MKLGRLVSSRSGHRAACKRSCICRGAPEPAHRVDVLTAGIDEVAPRREQLEGRCVHRVVLLQCFVDEALTLRQYDIAKVPSFRVCAEHALANFTRARSQLDRRRDRLVASSTQLCVRPRTRSLLLVEQRDAEAERRPRAPLPTGCAIGGDSDPELRQPRAQPCDADPPRRGFGFSAECGDVEAARDRVPFEGVERRHFRGQVREARLDRPLGFRPREAEHVVQWFPASFGFHLRASKVDARLLALVALTNQRYFGDVACSELSLGDISRCSSGIERRLPKLELLLGGDHIEICTLGARDELDGCSDSPSPGGLQAGASHAPPLR